MILATRGSRLALAQTEIVKRKLEELGENVGLLIVSTKGDIDRKSELAKIGGDGLFIRELERAVAEKRADAAVHSAKDMPYRLYDGLVTGAVPDEADPRDVLVMRKSAVKCIAAADNESTSRILESTADISEAFGEKLVIGTGSPRRETQLKKIFPEAVFKGIRGNVDTRLKKLADGEYDAIILAKAGLDRLGYELSGSADFVFYVFETDEVMPAPCQGLLAAECRAEDKRTRELLKRINNKGAEARFNIEREVFGAMNADCSMPVGIYARAVPPNECDAKSPELKPETGEADKISAPDNIITAGISAPDNIIEADERPEPCESAQKFTISVFKDDKRYELEGTLGDIRPAKR